MNSSPAITPVTVPVLLPRLVTVLLPLLAAVTGCRDTTPAPTVERAVSGAQRSSAQRPGPKPGQSTPPHPSDAPPAPGQQDPWVRLHRPPAATRYLWWEAESAKNSNFPKRHPFEPHSPQQSTHLSGGQWVGAEHTQETLYLEYELDIPWDGSARLFARKFWKHGPFRFRADDQPWRHITRDVTLLDSQALRKSVSANWVEAGELVLTPGKHTLRIEVPAPARAVAFDAFVLTQEPFLANGTAKPDAPLPPAAPGWVHFHPTRDTFTGAAFDLRQLNRPLEQPLRTKDGTLLRGQTVERFWGVNVGSDALALSRRAQEHYARHLAKRGVNLVRVHVPFFNPQRPREILPERLAGLQRWSHALAAEGIALGLSIYFPRWLKLNAEHGFPGYKGQYPFGLAFISPQFSDLLLGWWKQLLATPSAQTGVALKDDPVLAYVELINEDSTLFWTFKPHDAIPEAPSAALERRFGNWLSERYGSAANATERWANAQSWWSRLKGQLRSWGGKGQATQLEAGRVALLPLSRLSHKDRGLREQDSARFLAEQMRVAFQDWRKRLREEVGFRGPMVCSNWKTAHPQILDPLDNWANSTCEIMDSHGYLEGPHAGDASSYTVRNGQSYRSRSALRFQSPAQGSSPADNKPSSGFALPGLEARYNIKPAFISEVGWPLPNRFRAEGPLLLAAYGSLNGVDGISFFASEHAEWAPSLGKFSADGPMTLGQFPAAALIFRKGWVTEANPVAQLSRSEEQLFSLGGLPLGLAQNLDALRAADVPAGAAPDMDTASSLDPLSLLVGPVDIALGMSAAAPEQLTALDPWIDRTERIVRSRTGQLRWDYGRGVLQLNTPFAQGAVGFLGGAAVVLPSLVINADNEYASLMLVTLDDLPLAQSRRMLLQVGTEARNNGWALEPADAKGLQRIRNAGGPPIEMRQVEAQISITRPDAAALRVTALDVNGVAMTEARRGAETFKLLPEALYYLLEAP